MENIIEYESGTKVMVRNSDTEKWQTDVYEYYQKSSRGYNHRCDYNEWKQCRLPIGNEWDEAK